MDLVDLTALGAARAIRDGQISAGDYIDALLARAAAARPLNALLAQDAEAMRAAAREVDAAVARGDELGPLAGVPIVLKDNIDTKALATTAATGALQGRIPAADAPVAEALFRAGAILGGKTNMHELAFGITTNNSVTGATGNPYAPDRIPGGSSGGAGAAVAARLAPAGLGTDTGGSVRIPSSLCGICGFRPTVGRYPAAGIVPVSHTRDTAGPMARGVEDLIVLDSIITGDASPLEAIGLDGLRLGVPREEFFTDLDPGVASVVEAALSALSRAGVRLVEADIPDIARLVEAVGFPVVLYEVMRDLPAYLREADCGVDMQALIEGVGSPDVRAILDSQTGAEAMPEAAYRAAMEDHRPALQRAYAKYFSEHDLQAAIFPTTRLPARPIGDDETVELNGARIPSFAAFIANTDPGSNAGLPGVSLPAGLDPDGLPVGIAIDGPEASDQRILAIAEAIERELPAMPPPKFAAGAFQSAEHHARK